MDEALYALADCFNCVSGNIHTIHLNVRGSEFDTVHKKWTNKYYQELDDDYDSAAEWGRCYGRPAPNKNDSAARIQFQSLPGATLSCDDAVQLVQSNLEALLEQMHLLFTVANKKADTCPIATGVANWLQTRIEYWSKEIHFFNKNRVGVAI
jgi:DNA-binding ferritin-like protein